MTDTDFDTPLPSDAAALLKPVFTTSYGHIYARDNNGDYFFACTGGNKWLRIGITVFVTDAVAKQMTPSLIRQIESEKKEDPFHFQLNVDGRVLNKNSRQTDLPKGMVSVVTLKGRDHVVAESYVAATEPQNGLVPFSLQPVRGGFMIASCNGGIVTMLAPAS